MRQQIKISPLGRSQCSLLSSLNHAETVLEVGYDDLSDSKKIANKNKEIKKKLCSVERLSPRYLFAAQQKSMLLSTSLLLKLLNDLPFKSSLLILFKFIRTLRTKYAFQRGLYQTFERILSDIKTLAV